MIELLAALWYAFLSAKVTIHNDLPLDYPTNAAGLSIHWHGLSLDSPDNSAVWNDGVPYVHHCPIVIGSKMTYRFVVTETPGVHLTGPLYRIPTIIEFLAHSIGSVGIYSQENGVAIAGKSKFLGIICRYWNSETFSTKNAFPLEVYDPKLLTWACNLW